MLRNPKIPEPPRRDWAPTTSLSPAMLSTRHVNEPLEIFVSHMCDPSRQFTPKKPWIAVRTLHRTASVSSYVRNNEILWQRRYCVSSTCGMITKISEGSWQLRTQHQGSVTGRRLNVSKTLGGSDNKTVFTSKYFNIFAHRSTSTFAMLETEIVSCTISNRTPTFVFWFTRLSIERTCNQRKRFGFFDCHEEWCQGSRASPPQPQFWFFLFIKKRKEAIRLLTKPRCWQARRQSQMVCRQKNSRGGCSGHNESSKRSPLSTGQE